MVNLEAHNTPTSFRKRRCGDRIFFSTKANLFINFLKNKKLYKSFIITFYLFISQYSNAQKIIKLDNDYYLKNDSICIKQIPSGIVNYKRLFPIHNQLATLETVNDFQAREEVTTYVRNSKRKIIMIVKQRWGFVTDEMWKDTTIKNYDYVLYGLKKNYDSSRVEVTEIVFPETPCVGQLNYWFKDKKELCLFIASFMANYSGNCSKEKSNFTLKWQWKDIGAYPTPKKFKENNSVKFVTEGYDSFN